MKFYFKKNFFLTNFDLLYCTNIHFGESWKEIFYILKFYSRKMRNNFISYDQFGVGLRLSNISVIDISKFLVKFDFLFWLSCNNFYIKSINGFPYGFFSSNYIKDNVYLPDWSLFQRYIYSRRIIILFSFFLKKNYGGISVLPISYKFFFFNFIYNSVYIKSIMYLCNLIVLLHNIYIKNKILLHLDIEPEPDCIISNTIDFINFFKNWLFNKCVLYFFFNKSFIIKNVYFFISNYIRICFDICHSSVEFESVRQSIHCLSFSGLKIGKIQISSSLKFKNCNFNDICIFSYFPDTPYLHQVYGNTFYENIILYRDISLCDVFLYNENILEYRIHYHIPIFLENYEFFESTQDYIVSMFYFLSNKNFCSILEIETYTFDILPCYLKVNIFHSLFREYMWIFNKYRIFES